jgi:hypothetical protein
LDRSTSGSSSGSGVAAAANLCAVAIGTETDGSVVSPSSCNGLVGLKPTVGLLSRSGIIPISSTQDTAGPMARTVRDAALLLSALQGPDPADPAQLPIPANVPTDYTPFLKADSLTGQRLGVEKAHLNGPPAVAKLLKQAVEALKAKGATIVEVELVKKINPLGEAEFDVLLYEFKEGVNKYLAGAGAAVRNLADVIAYNNAHPAEAMPIFEQETLIMAEKTDGLNNAKYKAAVKKTVLESRKIIDATLRDNNELCRRLLASPLQGLQTLPCVNPSVPGGAYVEENAKRTEGKLSGTINISYKPSRETLVYGSYSRGYKAGGFNLDRSALPRQTTATSAGPVLGSARLTNLEFEPEINDAFELGMKYNGRGVDLNIAAFHQIFDDFQLNTFNGVNFQVENVNSCGDSLLGLDRDNNSATGACTGKVKGGVRSRGVEVELFTRPVTDVSFNIGATFVDTAYRTNLVGVDGRPLSSALFQLPGRRVSNSSEFSLTTSIGFNPRITSSGIRALIYADARHSGEFNTGSDLDIEKLQSAYTVVNARIGLQGPSNLWGVELWAQNLFNEDYQQVAFDAPVQGFGTTGGSNTRRGVDYGYYPRSNQLFGAFLAEPRTYGLTLRTRF